MPAFTPYAITDDRETIHALDRAFPSSMRTWKDARHISEADDTHFGYVHKGHATICVGDENYRLQAGMFFVVPGKFSVVGGEGVIITREGYKGFFQIGGPIEHEGRLKYIDGCTDSLLVSPVRWGDPCLNLLYFPADIDQTEHVHPSDRIGIVMSGKGACVYRDSADAEPVSIDLVPGMVFCIHTNGHHKFQTPYGEHMRVLAFHPDSDFGPRDEDHPMVNRTIVDGVSAKHIDEIRTK